jgi:hypothetical protein
MLISGVKLRDSRLTNWYTVRLMAVKPINWSGGPHFPLGWGSGTESGSLRACRAHPGRLRWTILPQPSLQLRTIDPHGLDILPTLGKARVEFAREKAGPDLALVLSRLSYVLQSEGHPTRAISIAGRRRA